MRVSGSTAWIKSKLWYPTSLSPPKKKDNNYNHISHNLLLTSMAYCFARRELMRPTYLTDSPTKCNKFVKGILVPLDLFKLLLRQAGEYTSVNR